MSTTVWRPALVGNADAIETRFFASMARAEASYATHCETMAELRRAERRVRRHKRRRKGPKGREKWAGKPAARRVAARYNVAVGLGRVDSATWLAAQLRVNPTRWGTGKPGSPSQAAILARLKAERLGAEPLPLCHVKAPCGAHELAELLLDAAGIGAGIGGAR